MEASTNVVEASTGSRKHFHMYNFLEGRAASKASPVIIENSMAYVHERHGHRFHGHRARPWIISWKLPRTLQKLPRVVVSTYTNAGSWKVAMFPRNLQQSLPLNVQCPTFMDVVEASTDFVEDSMDSMNVANDSVPVTSCDFHGSLWKLPLLPWKR